MPRSKNNRPLNESGRFAIECPEVNDPEYLRKAYWEEGKTQKQIAEDLGVTIGWIKVKFRQFGIKGRSYSERDFSYTLTPEQRLARGWPEKPIGQAKHFNRPRAYDSEGTRTKESRVIAAQMLGRKLKRTEVVHHIDEDPFNNAPENLMVLASKAEHGRLHWALWKDRSSRA